MNKLYGSQEQVRRMYEKFPYPSPVAGDDLIIDLANVVGFTFPEDEFEGKTIIDFGCGSGHRIVGLAKRYPKAKVVGVDMTSASLTVARDLASKHDASNMEFFLPSPCQPV